MSFTHSLYLVSFDTQWEKSFVSEQTEHRITEWNVHRIWTSEDESQRWITHGNGLHRCWIIQVLLYILLNYL